MPRRSSIDRDLLATADSQMGLITAAQLVALGGHYSTASRRSAGRMWTRVLPGVHLVGGGMPSRGQRLVAALLYAGRDSMLTGTAALRLYGFRALRLQEVADDEPDRPEPVHVLVPHARRRTSTGFVRVERTHRLPSPHRLRSFPVAPLVRSVGDAARRMPRESDAVAVVAEALQRGWATVAELEREAAEGPRRGGAHLRAAVAALATGAHSAPEADLAELLARGGFAHVTLNVRIVTRSGAFVGLPDAWLDDVGVAIEVDSVEHHASLDGFERTVRRNARYAAAGVTVVAVLPSDLRRRPAAVLADIRGAVEAARNRGRPAVAMAESSSRSAGRPSWPWGA